MKYEIPVLLHSYDIVIKLTYCTVQAIELDRVNNKQYRTV